MRVPQLRVLEAASPDEWCGAALGRGPLAWTMIPQSRPRQVRDPSPNGTPNCVCIRTMSATAAGPELRARSPGIGGCRRP